MHRTLSTKGFQYGAEFIPVVIDTVVVVGNGTELGNSTVDLILTDADGQKYVALITGQLLKAIPC